MAISTMDSGYKDPKTVEESISTQLQRLSIVESGKTAKKMGRVF